MVVNKHLKFSKKEFKNELKKAFGGAMVAALGFIMALSWRDVLNEYVAKIVILSPIQGKLISAIIITIIAVAIILIITHFTKSK